MEGSLLCQICFRWHLLSRFIRYRRWDGPSVGSRASLGLTVGRSQNISNRATRFQNQPFRLPAIWFQNQPLFRASRLRELSGTQIQRNRCVLNFQNQPFCFPARKGVAIHNQPFCRPDAAMDCRASLRPSSLLVPPHPRRRLKPDVKDGGATVCRIASESWPVSSKACRRNEFGRTWRRTELNWDMTACGDSSLSIPLTRRSRFAGWNVVLEKKPKSTSGQERR